MLLSPSEAAAIEACVARVEARTGVPVVAAVIDKADTYIELPWKAFALGASVAALAVVAGEGLRPDWLTAHVALVHVVMILGVAAASALLAVFVPSFARLFLRPARGHLEVRHYARSLFLTRELFETRERNGILLLISRFERQVDILPDTGLHDRVSEGDWRAVIVRMTPLLRHARVFDALREGLAALEDMLGEKGCHGHAGAEDQLPNQPIEERGA